MSLYLACDEQDYTAETGECSDPYFASPPSLFPQLTAAEGLQIGFAIVSVWTIGLIARVLIRTAQAAEKN